MSLLLVRGVRIHSNRYPISLRSTDIPSLSHAILTLSQSMPLDKIPAGNLALARGCLVIATDRELLGYVPAGKRIEERRKQMRDEAERMKQQNRSPEQMRQEQQHLNQQPQQQ